ncbi:hypothetical protein CRG98_012019 [Punica granatum]|uniref:Uncharacterized protein n=1 Tax=Punica granatum TaxID=22663 RepID=A0A2I0KIE7_PUNGR|nr:hypothetical protein CRG98_012019 [Punica granatum]
MGNRGSPGATVEWGCPGLHLLKWPVAGALCDVSDHLLLSFIVRASWRVHAAEVSRCSRKTVTSMLSDSLDCPRLQLHRGYLIVRHLPRQSIRNGSKTSSQGSVNSRIALRLWSMCPCEDDKEDNALGYYVGEYVSTATAEDGWVLFFGRKRDGACAYCCKCEGYALFVELSLSAFVVKGLDLLLEGRNPNVVNAGPEPDVVNARPEADAEPKPNAGPKPNAVNTGPEPDAGPKPKAGPKPNAVNAGSIGKCKKCKSKGHAERRASDHAVRLSVSKKLVSISLAWECGSALGPQLALPWRKGEGRRSPAREGWHDLPVMWGG